MCLTSVKPSRTCSKTTAPGRGYLANSPTSRSNGVSEAAMADASAQQTTEVTTVTTELSLLDQVLLETKITPRDEGYRGTTSPGGAWRLSLPNSSNRPHANSFKMTSGASVGQTSSARRYRRRRQKLSHLLPSRSAVGLVATSRYPCPRYHATD